MSILNICLSPGVVMGHCVVVHNDQIVYAGPIKDCPKQVEHMDIHMCQADFDKMAEIIKRKRH